MQTELPLSIRYCIRANKMSCYFLVALNLGILVGVFPLITSRLKVNAGHPIEAALFIGIIVLIFLLIHFPILLFRGLNAHLSRADGSIMSKQVFWSCWFLLIFPVGTILHMGVFYYMLFSKETYDLFEQNAWDAPKPYWGIVKFVLVLLLAAGLILGLPVLFKAMGKVKDMMPKKKVEVVTEETANPAAGLVPEGLMKGINKLGEDQNIALSKMKSELAGSGSSVFGVLDQAHKDGEQRQKDTMDKLQNASLTDVMGGAGPGAAKMSGIKTKAGADVKKKKTTKLFSEKHVKKGKGFFVKFYERWFLPQDVQEKKKKEIERLESQVLEGEKFDKETGNVYF